MEEGMLVLRAYITPVIRGQPGLLSLALIPNRFESRITIFSLWDTPAHAQAVDLNHAYRQALSRLYPLLAGQPPAPAPARASWLRTAARSAAFLN